MNANNSAARPCHPESSGRRLLPEVATRGARRLTGSTPGVVFRCVFSVPASYGGPPAGDRIVTALRDFAAFADALQAAGFYDAVAVADPAVDQSLLISAGIDATNAPSALPTPSSSPTASATGTSSPTSTRTQTSTRTSTRTSTATATSTPTSSRTSSRTRTPTMTPTPSLIWTPWERSLVVVRLGDAARNAGNTDVGTALPVFFDYYDTADPRPAASVRPWLSVPVKSTAATSGAAGTSQACTLAHGSTDADKLLWFLDTEGLPSTAGDGSAVVLPCHTSPAGSRVSTLLADAKTIAILRRNGTVDTTIRFTGYTGVRGTATGLRTAVTTNTREFWLAGIANSNYGVRYLSGPRANSTGRVQGAVARADGSYQPATIDVRGLTLWGSQTYLTSAYATEPNKNMPAADDSSDGLTPWGGIVRIGAYGALVRNATKDARLLRGMDGRRNMHGFAFSGPQELFIAEDVNRYVRMAGSVAVAQLAEFGSADASNEAGWPRTSSSQAMAMSAGGTDPRRPLLARASLTTAIVRWFWSTALGGSEWKEDAARKVYISDACYSLVVRREVGVARATTVVYTSGRTKVYRVVPETRVVTVLVSSTPASGQLFRGVAIPPTWGAATPSPTRTRTRAAPSKSTTRTRTPKRRGT